MTLSFAPTTDFLSVTDGLAAVTLLRRGSSTTTAIAHALRRAISKRELAASNGLYVAEDCRYHLSVSECAAAPRLGDVILDAAGTRWTILDVAKETMGTRWACNCRDVAAVHRLDCCVDILRATYAADDAGAAEPTWTVYRSGVRARIQPATTDMRIENEARIAAKGYTIYADTDADLDTTHRVRGPNGVMYKILRVTGAERIGELVTIEAEVTPWPRA